MMGLTGAHICQAQEKWAGLAFDFPLQSFTMVTIVSVQISQQMQLLQQNSLVLVPWHQNKVCYAVIYGTKVWNQAVLWVA